MGDKDSLVVWPVAGVVRGHATPQEAGFGGEDNSERAMLVLA